MSQGWIATVGTDGPAVFESPRGVIGPFGASDGRCWRVGGRAIGRLRCADAELMCCMVAVICRWDSAMLFTAVVRATVREALSFSAISDLLFRV